MSWASSSCLERRCAACHVRAHSQAPALGMEPTQLELATQPYTSAQVLHELTTGALQYYRFYVPDGGVKVISIGVADGVELLRLVKEHLASHGGLDVETDICERIAKRVRRAAASLRAALLARFRRSKGQRCTVCARRLSSCSTTHSPSTASRAAWCALMLAPAKRATRGR